MFQEILDTYVWPALITVVGTAITIGSGLAIGALRRWSEQLKVDWARDVLAQASDAADRAVRTLNQTFVADLKAGASFDAGNAKVALHRALTATARQLGEDGMKALEKITGSAEKADLVLHDLVEGAVDKTKTTTALAVR